jgi:CMP-N,N'-diacetyllegionaminic acid synthase
MKRIATICARAGSKGIPGKNIRDLGGKPLIAYTIEQARASNLFDAVAVSSDGDNILDIANRWGVEHLIKRPKDLASDSAAKLPTIRHCVEAVEEFSGATFDTIVDLAVTSPLRNVDDIRGAVKLMEESNSPNVLSAHVATDSPYYNMVEIRDENCLAVVKSLPDTFFYRQDVPICYALNGAVYVWSRGTLFAEYERVILETSRVYVMDRDRSLDLDTEYDFKVARAVMEYDKQSAKTAK